MTNLLNLLKQDMEHGDPAADPTVLGAISAPVMVLLGSDTKHFFAASAQHVADHVPNARRQEIPGVGHAAPLTHPAVFLGPDRGGLECSFVPALVLLCSV